MQDLSLKSIRTYHSHVRILGQHFAQDPATINEDQLREYFLYCRGVKRYVPATMNQIKAAFIHLFHGHLAIQPRWQVFTDLKIKHRDPFPVVLTREEVRLVLAQVNRIKYHTILSLIYATGLRIGEACRLEVTDIDAQAGRLLVRKGKGQKSRFVPITPQTVTMLRRWWSCHRNRQFLFPAVGRNWYNSHTDTPVQQFQSQCLAMRSATKPMSSSGTQNAMRFACGLCGLKKKATPHTLRHCFATHLLEDGVSIRLISAYLGHANLQTTLLYVHLSVVTEETTRTAMRSIFDDIIAPGVGDVELL